MKRDPEIKMGILFSMRKKRISIFPFYAIWSIIKAEMIAYCFALGGVSDD